MADKQVRASNGSLVEAFVYEGEDLAMEYSDGTLHPIPADKIHHVLFPSRLADGEKCWIVVEKTPITRLPIVVIEKKVASNGKD